MTGLQKLRKKQEIHTLIDNVLPFHYQGFMLNYYTGKNGFYEEYVKLPNDDFKFPFNYIKYSKLFNDGIYENSLWYFYDLAEIYAVSDSILEQEEKKDYLVVRQFHTPDLLLVGINEENKDKIFVKFGDTALDMPHIRYLDANIYSFLNSCEVVYSLNILGNISVSQLYRNWNEDFWRIREE